MIAQQTTIWINIHPHGLVPVVPFMATTALNLMLWVQVILLSPHVRIPQVRLVIVALAYVYKVFYWEMNASGC